MSFIRTLVYKQFIWENAVHQQASAEERGSIFTSSFPPQPSKSTPNEINLPALSTWEEVLLTQNRIGRTLETLTGAIIFTISLLCELSRALFFLSSILLSKRNHSQGRGAVKLSLDPNPNCQKCCRRVPRCSEQRGSGLFGGPNSTCGRFRMGSSKIEVKPCNSFSESFQSQLPTWITLQTRIIVMMASWNFRNPNACRQNVWWATYVTFLEFIAQELH